ncbi:hypothetical protein JW890_02105 [candidate division WOR-3 bacterium]|nr:hypothetical protein [candidate division WOR-3 bacterium]
MIYLLLAVLSSSSVAAILKISEQKQCERLKVASFNYLSAFLIASALLMAENFSSQTAVGILDHGSRHGLTGFFTSGTEKFFVLWSLTTGLAGGILYLSGFLAIQSSIKENGMALTGAVSKLGAVLPVVLSFFLFREKMSAAKTAGTALSIASLLIISGQKGGLSSGKKHALVFIWVLFSVGAAEFSNKLFENFAPESYKRLFLFCVFSTALVLSASLGGFRLRKKNIFLKSAAAGILVGVPNLFSSYFLISSFKFYPAAVAFSVYSVGSILTMTLAGALFFRERISRCKYLALVLICISLILMNL